MAVVVVSSSGGSVLANFSSVCQFLVTEVRRATTNSLPCLPFPCDSFVNRPEERQ